LADCARCHLSGSGVKHLLHKHRTVREVSGLAMRDDGLG
jgi:hypothetical protein